MGIILGCKYASAFFIFVRKYQKCDRVRVSFRTVMEFELCIIIINQIMMLQNWIMESHNCGVLSLLAHHTIKQNKNKISFYKISHHDFPFLAAVFNMYLLLSSLWHGRGFPNCMPNVRIHQIMFIISFISFIWYFNDSTPWLRVVAICLLPPPLNLLAIFFFFFFACLILRLKLFSES